MSNNELTTLSLADANLKATRNGFTFQKDLWYSWNYWAQHSQHLFSFDDWLDEHGLRSGDVKAKAKYRVLTGAIFKRETGYRYYCSWRGAQVALNDSEKEFDEQLRLVWEKCLPDGEPAFSNEQIGVALGKDAEQLRKFVSKRSWHKPRTKKGTKK